MYHQDATPGFRPMPLRFLGPVLAVAGMGVLLVCNLDMLHWYVTTSLAVVGVVIGIAMLGASFLPRHEPLVPTFLVVTACVVLALAMVTWGLPAGRLVLLREGSVFPVCQSGGTMVGHGTTHGKGGRTTWAIYSFPAGNSTVVSATQEDAARYVPGQFVRVAYLAWYPGFNRIIR
ncbi:MAG: hypothetical protein BWK76_00335 [Desulfobulbaceae bacterium A2]|nr:MAG: hypothetical protein BWK76_00335 [Desulfobulbaceae bacterium A2]